MAAATYAIRAQVYNPLALDRERRQILNIPEEARWRYGRIARERWQPLHQVALAMYYCGLSAFLSGTLLLIWAYLGAWTGRAFVAVIVLTQGGWLWAWWRSRPAAQAMTELRAAVPPLQRHARAQAAGQTDGRGRE